MKTKKYEVYIKRTEWGYLNNIEAKNKEEAIEKAEAGYHNGDVFWGDEDLEIEEVKEIKQKKIDNKLIKMMLKNKFKCPECNHLFSKEEIVYYISDASDNQNCPKCKGLIT